MITKRGTTTSSSLLRHTCYKSWLKINGETKGDEPEKLSSDEMRKAREMIEQATLFITWVSQ